MTKAGKKNLVNRHRFNGGAIYARGDQRFSKFFDREIFPFPKPVAFIKQLLASNVEYASDGGDDIIIDFFAGSATTAHAVLDLNKQDGGHRKFILVNYRAWL